MVTPAQHNSDVDNPLHSSTGSAVRRLISKQAEDYTLASSSASPETRNSTIIPGQESITAPNNGWAEFSPGLELTTTGRRKRALKGKRVHKCNICNKLYTRNEHLQRHKSTKHCPRAYPCEIANCSKSFHRADLLHRHQRQHIIPPLTRSISTPNFPTAFQNLQQPLLPLPLQPLRPLPSSRTLTSGTDEQSQLQTGKEKEASRKKSKKRNSQLTTTATTRYAGTTSPPSSLSYMPDIQTVSSSSATSAGRGGGGGTTSPSPSLSPSLSSGFSSASEGTHITGQQSRLQQQWQLQQHQHQQPSPSSFPLSMPFDDGSGGIGGEMSAYHGEDHGTPFTTMSTIGAGYGHDPHHDHHLLLLQHTPIYQHQQFTTPLSFVQQTVRVDEHHHQQQQQQQSNSIMMHQQQQQQQNDCLSLPLPLHLHLPLLTMENECDERIRQQQQQQRQQQQQQHQLFLDSRNNIDSGSDGNNNDNVQARARARAGAGAETGVGIGESNNSFPSPSPSTVPTGMMVMDENGCATNTATGSAQSLSPTASPYLVGLGVQQGQGRLLHQHSQQQYPGSEGRWE